MIPPSLYSGRIIRRGIIAALLAGAIINPALLLKSDDIDLFILVDDSQSIQSAKTLPAWKYIVDLVNNLSHDSRFSIIRFGTGAAIEHPLSPQNSPLSQSLLKLMDLPRNKTVDTAATNISNAVNLALQEMPNPGNSVILLFTDGLETQASLKQFLTRHKINIPFYVKKIPHAEQDASQFFLRLNMPDRVSTGVPFKVNSLIHNYLNRKINVTTIVDDKVINTHSLPPGPDEIFAYEPALQLENTGAHLVKILVTDINGAELTSRKQVINAYGKRKVLIVSNFNSPFKGVLKNTDVELSMASPGVVRSQHHLLANASTVILNEISYYDLDEATWVYLSDLIKIMGLGLIVTGNTNAFALGAYRKTYLEEVLPVISEPKQPDAPASILFLLDKSGSMATEMHEANKLTIAYNAIFESAKSISANDQVGLLAFDTAVKVELPLGSYLSPKNLLAESMKLTSSGGTNLDQAISDGINHLSESRHKDKILVLVTDGASPLSNADTLRSKLDAFGIKPVILVINPTGTIETLKKVAESNQGKLMLVDDILRLPRMMRSEIENLQTSKKTMRQKIVEHTPIPGFPLQPAGWPEISEVVATQTKASATEYLATTTGEPVVSAHRLGAGWVIAIPASMAAWLKNWHDKQRFMETLIDWADSFHGDITFSPLVEIEPGQIRWTLDLVNSKPDWLRGINIAVNVHTPNGHIITPTVEQSGPGQVRFAIPAYREGVYLANIRESSQNFNHGIYYPMVEHYMEPAAGSRKMTEWIDSGMVLPWNNGMLPGDIKRAGYEKFFTGPYFLLIAALGYFIILLWELKLQPLTAKTNFSGRQADSAY